MHLLRRTIRLMLAASAIALALTALGLTNADPDTLETDRLHNLAPLSGVLRTILLLFGSVLLVIAAVVTVLRRRVNASLYKAAADEHWEDDALDETAVPLEEDEVAEACTDIGKPAPADDGVNAAVAEVVEHKPVRVFTPASGPAWDEPMLNAFLSACLKANCLGRAWREEAARRPQGQRATARLSDPREAEFFRILKARWQEFHVDPENGIFLERAGAGGQRSRVCLIQVSREKHAVARAALNAGFVIESLGRYLRSSDVVHPNGLGHYHAPTREDLLAMPETQKKQVIRLRNIPDPWHAMIAGRRA